MRETLLFIPWQSPLYEVFELLFENLPRLPERSSSQGRKPIDRNLLFRALIYRTIRGMRELNELVERLEENPALCHCLGFDPSAHVVPSVERFSAFLKDTPNEHLQLVRRELVRRLVREKVSGLDEISLDSSPLPVRVKENNPKATCPDRFNKLTPPRGDPEARLGVLIHYENGKKTKRYFWGYRNHVICDTQSELPVEELTLPANVSEITIARSLITSLIKNYGITPGVVIADASFDAEELLSFIMKDLGALAIVAPRYKRRLFASEPMLCEAGLKMYRKGTMRVKRHNRLYEYLQYSCPFYYGPKNTAQELFCPAAHPKFNTQQGCNILIRLNTIRKQIHYDSDSFKEHYNKRSSVERLFSRLLSLSMPSTYVRGHRSIANTCTISHITVLLVALTAHLSGCKDKMRFVKSVFKNLLSKDPIL